ncbi:MULTISPECIES: DNA-directed RNA polymerase subunit omega [Aerococcus]|uniref:DNA-directed RNA polymerase subunit omega n=1 Tax=Aerococcus sanguinicola TaxID=119206 RepID=A0A5N1GL73_9LACT|nr:MULTISPECIES: DNA-directed RNA polymerase subunit omega [Aerococcus]KAA9300791.1 DNA-directed RNA polymerase subunit omega [Aerococcus sanguinicola]MDK6369423.1 DNA-directed RNA polymerase subunit omega [Aerococcus sp. UMB9870]MDK6680486.1 DNA-directed RNA polymerase subunit omega [Aerococcus sp. UMB8608]MDK6686714.1 DNA-directed RNA polymerase subunit omega [Aerococcus sp. UMB8623]MDK6940433.1 DNA-directed RNA polymerase subunit omega [Aerococcus sp. UMB8487]
MIIYPSIDRLLEKVNSKYSLCSVSAKRAHDLQVNHNPMLNEYRSPKYVGQALEEITSNDLVIDPESLR